MAQTIELKGFIQARRSYDGAGFDYYFMLSEDMSAHGYIRVCPHVTSFEVPDTFNPVAVELAALEQKRDIIRAEFNATLRQINERIAKLQALEFTPSEVAA